MRTGIMKLTVAFRNFADAPKKKHKSEVHVRSTEKHKSEVHVRSTGKCLFTTNGFR